MSEVDPTTLFGFNPKSPYAELFVDVYNLTVPNKEEFEQVKVDANMNIESFCEKISDDDEKEEGEIDDNDNKIEAIIVPINKPKVKTYLKKSTQPRSHPLNPTPGHSTGQSAHRIEGGGSRSSNVLDLQTQIDLDNNPVRLHWLHLLLEFMKGRGTPIKFSPTIPTAVSLSPELPTTKQPLDLYSLYQNTMTQAGGLAGCTETKSWKAVAVRMNVPVQKAFVLRSIYHKFLFPFEEFQNSQERKALLPTPVMPGLQGSSLQSLQQVEDRRFSEYQRGRGGGKRGNIMKRLGFKKKGGNFKRGGVPRFRGFHG